MAKTHTELTKHNYFSRYLIGGGDRKIVEDTIRRAHSALEDVPFDTFVVVGISGALAGGILAHALDKNLYVLRKPEDSTHDGKWGFGVMGTRWVFLDDFISTGTTYKGVKKRMEDLYKEGAFDKQEWRPEKRDYFTTKHARLTQVGAYLYSEGQYLTKTQADNRGY